MQAVEKLTLCDYKRRPEVQGSNLRAALAPAPRVEPPTAGLQASAGASGAEDDADEDDEGEEMDTEALDPEEVREAAEALFPPPSRPTGFVVSVTKGASSGAYTW